MENDGTMEKYMVLWKIYGTMEKNMVLKLTMDNYSKLWITIVNYSLL